MYGSPCTCHHNILKWMCAHVHVLIDNIPPTHHHPPPPVISTSWPSHGNSPLTRNRNIAKATTTMMKEGTMNDHPQGSLTSSQSAQNEGMIVPRMLPTEVWEFQIPMIRPRLRGVVCVCAWERERERERERENVCMRATSKVHNMTHWTSEMQKISWQDIRIWHRGMQG